MAAPEGGPGLANLVPGGVPPDGVVFRVLLVHSLGSVVALENRAQHGRGTGADRAIVEINLVCRDEELLAHLGPVSVFVLVEQHRIGKRRRGAGELGNEISAEGGDGSKAGSCSREETAAVDQNYLLA